MRPSLLYTISLAAALAEGYLVSPPGPVLPETITDCSGWVLPTPSDTCATIASKNGITVAQFIQYVSSTLFLMLPYSSDWARNQLNHLLTIYQNPLVGSACTLTVGFAYCIQENGGKSPRDDVDHDYVYTNPNNSTNKSNNHSCGQWHHDTHTHPSGYGLQLRRLLSCPSR